MTEPLPAPLPAPPPATVERTADGFVVDAALLAEAFRLPVAEVQARMRDGRIASRCEQGMGDDAGRWRLTFHHAGRACRLTLGPDGTVLARTTFPATRATAAARPASPPRSP